MYHFTVAFSHILLGYVDSTIILTLLYNIYVADTTIYESAADVWQRKTTFASYTVFRPKGRSEILLTSAIKTVVVKAFLSQRWIALLVA